MAVQILSLASGALSTTTPPTQAIYPKSAPSVASIVKSIRLVNASTVTRLVNLYFQPAGGATQYRISPKDMVLPPGVMVIDDQEITLGAKDASNNYDQIFGTVDSGPGTDLHYVISGIQR
jgi:hypothetical protein